MATKNCFKTTKTKHKQQRVFISLTAINLELAEVISVAMIENTAIP